MMMVQVVFGPQLLVSHNSLFELLELLFLFKCVNNNSEGVSWAEKGETICKLMINDIIYMNNIGNAIFSILKYRRVDTIRLNIYIYTFLDF